VLFESAERLSAFVALAATEQLTRVAKAQLASVDADFLAELASDESRRIKATVTLSGDHLSIDRNGETLDGPLNRS